MRHTTDIRWFFRQLSNVSVYRTGNQDVADMGAQTIGFNTENYDNIGEFNPATYTFTALNAGYYRLMVNINCLAGAASGQVCLQVLTNAAATVGQRYKYLLAGISLGVSVFVDRYLAVGGILYCVLENMSGDTVRILGGSFNSYLSVERIPVIT